MIRSDEPRRLLEDVSTSDSSSDFARSLLRAAKEYAPSDGARAATHAAVSAVRASTAAPRAASTGVLAKATLVGIACAIAGALAWHATHGARRSSATPAEAIVSMASASALVAPAPSAQGELAAVASASAEPAPSVVVDKPAHRPRASSSLPAAQASGDTLAAEIALIDRASKALHAGDANGALSLLDAHRREFPRGRLGLEAEVLRIESMARAGRSAEAASRAHTFLAKYPKSPLASRVRAFADAK